MRVTIEDTGIEEKWIGQCDENKVCLRFLVYIYVLYMMDRCVKPQPLVHIVKMERLSVPILTHPHPNVSCDVCCETDREEGGKKDTNTTDLSKPSAP